MEQEEIIEILLEEIQEFFQWMIEEIGEDYYMEDPDAPRFSWENAVDTRIRERMNSERARLWERDRYAAFEHPSRPSLYQVLKSEDLELLHFLQEDPCCDHFKVGPLNEESSDASAQSKRYDEPFSVIAASQSLGYMYRLDFCDICGLVEIWSMTYDAGEISLLTS